MSWKVRKDFDLSDVLVDVRKAYSDPRISDGAARTYAWLLVHGNEESAAASLFERARKIGRGVLLGQLSELIGIRLVDVSHADGIVEVRLMDPRSSYAAREAVLSRASERHRERAAESDKKKAAKHGHRVDVRGDETDVPEKCVSMKDVYGRWRDAWDAAFPGVACLPWGRKEMGIAKQLAGRIGGDELLRAVDLVISGWQGIASRYGLRGYPSIEWMMRYRETALLELLSGKKVGNDFGKSAGVRKKARLRAGEFDGSAVEPVEDGEVGWGSGGD